MAHIIRGSTSRGAHVRALWEALTVLIEDLAEVPSHKRVMLRNTRAALERAHPGVLNNATELAQAIAEEDGEAVEPEEP